MKKDHNLNNPFSEPEHTRLRVTTTAHFNLIDAVPRKKLTNWLDSLPDIARITFAGTTSGKVYFEATWEEER